tara:strand:- start:2499 stop:2663 length:165 start_codon:yes stop_codon:yes gene_type:complete
LLVVVILIRPNLFPANWNNIGIKLEKNAGGFSQVKVSQVSGAVTLVGYILYGCS